MGVGSGIPGPNPPPDRRPSAAPRSTLIVRGRPCRGRSSVREAAAGHRRGARRVAPASSLLVFESIQPQALGQRRHAPVQHQLMTRVAQGPPGCRCQRGPRRCHRGVRPGRRDRRTHPTADRLRPTDRLRQPVRPKRSRRRVRGRHVLNHRVRPFVADLARRPRARPAVAACHRPPPASPLVCRASSPRSLETARPPHTRPPYDAQRATPAPGMALDAAAQAVSPARPPAP